MDMKKVSIQGLKAQLSGAVSEAEAGETIIITRHNEAVARLGPVMVPFLHRGASVASRGLRPAVTRGTQGRYLATLLEDRGER